MERVKQIEMQFLNDTVLDFAKVAKEQRMKGEEKYGKEIDPLDNNYKWSRMAKEELVDGYMYLEALERRIAICASKLRKLTSYKQNEQTQMEIKYWLDILEGKQD